MLLLICSGCNQTEYVNNEVHKEFNLQGKIKRIVEKSYLTTTSGEKIIRKRQDGTYENDFILDVRPDGLDFSFQYINSDDQEVKIVTYKANEKGLKTEEFRNGVRNKYSYNDLGQIKEEVSGDARIVYFYKNNRLTQRIFFVGNKEEERSTVFIDTIDHYLVELATAKGDTTEMRIYEENERGQLIYEKLYDETGLYESTENTYVEGKLAAEKWAIYDQGIQDGWIETNYENGNEVRSTEINQDSSVLFVETIKYEFDQQGNWIKKRVNRNNEDFFLLERLISYH